MAIVAFNAQVLVLQLVSLGDSLPKHPNVGVDLRDRIMTPDAHPDPLPGGVQLPADEHNLLKAAIAFLCDCHDEMVDNEPPEDQPEVDNSLPDAPAAPDNTLPDEPAPEQPDVDAPAPEPRKR